MAVLGRITVMLGGFVLGLALPVFGAEAKPSEVSKSLLAKPVPTKRERTPSALKEILPSLEDLRVLETRVKSVVARVSPAVVSVTVGNAKGSAVVISADGLVLTAAHVSGAPNQPVVFTFPDGRTAKGVTLGTNHAIDSGIMRITDAGPWPFAPVGDLDKAELGDWVIALGHPGGFDAQRPVVARLGRLIMNEPTLLQSDCTILGGDSGGPLFDISGRVIALHSSISDSAESNYHVPITTYMETWPRLAAGDNWGRAYVGASGVDHPDGFRVERVARGSPASKVGLQVGDIITKINGGTVKSSVAFEQVVSDLNLGSEVTLQIKRAGVDMVLRLTVEGPQSRRRAASAE